MSGDNLESYLRDFKFVASKLGSFLTDSDKRITFINGLSNQVALEVLRAKLTLSKRPNERHLSIIRAVV